MITTLHESFDDLCSASFCNGKFNPLHKILEVKYETFSEYGRTFYRFLTRFVELIVLNCMFLLFASPFLRLVHLRQHCTL